MDRDARQPMKGEPRGTRQSSLEKRSPELVAAAHVTRAGDDVGAPERERVHRINVARVVGTIAHVDQDIWRSCGREPGLDRVENSAPDPVAMQVKLRDLGLQALDYGDGRVLVEIVDDKDLEWSGSCALDHAFQGRHHVLALVVNGNNNAQGRQGLVQIRPALISSRIHGMTSSSISSRVVVASKPSISRAFRTSGTRI